eukprot:TRINITY_DN102306_c0_g1_i1.p1 TRINITY_DN102306_c0_g1~~TRINITY_DN102306_c0_g1_i1.p1  ORF type:complete len:607 (+),score=59.51 TRINITY_DN102306_c0_g1_i1:87-1907(+)
MKAIAHALTCATLASIAAAAKLASRISKSLETDAAYAQSGCAGNVINSSITSYTIGLTTGVTEVFTGDTLSQIRATLGNTPAWSFDRTWQFTARVDSGFARDLRFGFAGRQGGGINFTVPANANGVTISVNGKVKQEAVSFSLKYRGSASDLVDHQVTFTNLCLRQASCAVYEGCLPAYKYEKNSSVVGDTFETCCTPLYCIDQVSCTPDTKYENLSDFETRLGNTLDRCCKPKLCPAEICSGSDTTPSRQGTGILGSTTAECCGTMYCRDFNGCDSSIEQSKLSDKLADGRLRAGYSVTECCTTLSCSAFNCSKSELWTAKANTTGLSGHSFSACCDPLYCANFTCNASTMYVAKKDPPLQGNTSARCCDPVYCSDYTCSNASYTLMPGAENRYGSTDRDCCELALCHNYNCSDPDKYWKKPNLIEVNGVQGPRFGNSDSECCTPLYCRDFACSSTQWTNRKWAANDTTPGWTPELCCDQKLCTNYTCTTDYDGTGNGTKWYKKQDTNTIQWQGSTDEECCLPLFCSQYQTPYPTQWKPKENLTNATLGSTDAECSDPIWCSSFCGCSEAQGLTRLSDAANVQGSTADECCQNVSNATTEESSGF